VLFDKLAAQKKSWIFSTIFLFFDIPQYSNRFDYIKDIQPAIYFENQKSLHIIFKYIYRPVCLHCKYIDDLYQVQVNQFPVRTGQKCIHN